MKVNRFALFMAVAACCAMISGCGSQASKPSSTNSQGKDGGSARVDIKHATDPDAKNINLSAKDISVEDLLATKLPGDFKGNLEENGEKRIGEFENSTYRIKGILRSIVHRKDGDYFLTIEGTSGKSAVVEVPDPKLLESSPLHSKIEATRNQLESKYHPTDTPITGLNDPIEIEGVGFYGFRSKKGSGGNGSSPRLMPGTGFKPGK